MRVALVQMHSGADRSANLRDIAEAVASSASQGAELVMLPEVCSYRGQLDQEHVETLEGRTIAEVRRLAAAHHVAVLIGGVWTESTDRSRPFNTSVFVDDRGEILARYDKAHLFRLDYGAVKEDEGAYTTPGSRLVIVRWRGWSVGLSICYDLRFPEMYAALTAAGADVLCVPANFSSATGHWLPLLRARAIETGCFVLAPAQTGRDVTGFTANGETVGLDPWGVELGRLGQDPAILVVDLDRETLVQIRRSLTAARERRPALYATEVTVLPEDER